MRTALRAKCSKASAVLLCLILTSCMAAREPAAETTVTVKEEAPVAVTPTEESLTRKEIIARNYAYVLRQPMRHLNEQKDERFNLKAVADVEAIGMITGESSINQTRSRYSVGGTDLGIFVEHKDKMYLFFGDTFTGDDEGHPMVEDWRSNVLAYTTDFDASDGILFDGMMTVEKDRLSFAKELIGSKKVPYVEHTVIPTGGFSDGENLYCYFMSVKEWDNWTINYGGLAKSTDDGKTFTKLDGVQFDGSVFGQIAPLRVGDYLYCVGIPGGRHSSAKLMRVLTAEAEDMEAYEFFTGLDEQGAPVFKRGSQYQAEAAVVVDGDVGEPSIMYNPYLGEYMVTYLKLSENTIVLRVAKELWGPWSEPIALVNNYDYAGLYGGFIHEKYTEENGRIFYFTMSIWDPIYNSGLLKVELEKRN